MLFRTPSIQPKHSATSTDSGHVMLGFPEFFCGSLPIARGACHGWASSQARKSAGVGKNVGFGGMASTQIDALSFLSRRGSHFWIRSCNLDPSGTCEGCRFKSPRKDTCSYRLPTYALFGVPASANMMGVLKATH